MFLVVHLKPHSTYEVSIVTTITTNKETELVTWPKFTEQVNRRDGNWMQAVGIIGAVNHYMLPTLSLFSWGKLILYNFKVSWLVITIIPNTLQIIKWHFLANIKAKGKAEPKLDQSDWGKNVYSMVEREVCSRTKVHVSASAEGTHLPIMKEASLRAKPTWRRRRKKQQQKWPKESWRHEAGTLFYPTLSLLCLCPFFYIR